MRREHAEVEETDADFYPRASAGIEGLLRRHPLVVERDRSRKVNAWLLERLARERIRQKKRLEQRTTIYGTVVFLLFGAGCIVHATVDEKAGPVVIVLITVLAVYGNWSHERQSGDSRFVEDGYFERGELPHEHRKLLALIQEHLEA